MMSRLLVVLAGGALLGALAAGPALAAPADVTVRVEGTDTTLVPRTSVHTDATPVNKDGVAGHACSGTGAAGALEKATGGDWSGPWFDGLGYSVQTINGETHAFPAPEYFSLWINHRATSEGVCGATTELQQGDDVLLFVDRCITGPAPDFLCTNPPVLPMELSTPRTVTPGVAFTVSVVEYAAKGTPAPAAGAVVTGGDAPATTDAAGNATVTVGAGGPFSLRATKANRAPTATESGCATTGDDGQCGSPVPAAPCATSGSDGRCGSPDREAPAAAITGITEGRRFARGHGPRRLTATIAPDVSGLQVVKLRLTRTDGPRCTYYSGRSERFRRAPCGVNRAPWFAVGDRETVDYLLPQKLGRGRYVFDVNVVDKAGNRDDVRRRGSNRVVFHVR
jgi:hypothetical protein